MATFGWAAVAAEVRKVWAYCSLPKISIVTDLHPATIAALADTQLLLPHELPLVSEYEVYTDGSGELEAASKQLGSRMTFPLHNGTSTTVLLNGPSDVSSRALAAAF